MQPSESSPWPLPTIVTVVVPVNAPEGSAKKDNSVGSGPLSVSSPTEITRLLPDPVLLVRLKTVLNPTKPNPVVVDAVTGEFESELNAVASAEATVWGVSDPPKGADSETPFTVTEMEPVL